MMGKMDPAMRAQCQSMMKRCMTMMGDGGAGNKDAAEGAHVDSETTNGRTDGQPVREIALAGEEK